MNARRQNLTRDNYSPSYKEAKVVRNILQDMKKESIKIFGIANRTTPVGAVIVGLQAASEHYERTIKGTLNVLVKHSERSGYVIVLAPNNALYTVRAEFFGVLDLGAIHNEDDIIKAIKELPEDNPTRLAYFGPNSNLRSEGLKEDPIKQHNPLKELSLDERRAAIEEMKSKIDSKERIQMAKAISAGTRLVDFFDAKNAVERMVDDWAEAKVDLYLLLGRRVRVHKSIHVKVEDKIIDEMVKEYGSQNTLFHQILGSFSPREWISNEIRRDLLLNGRKVRGMKVTKYIASLKSEELNIIASTLTQTKEVQRHLYLSIHPMDFLLMSETNSGLSSCHRLDGDYGTAAFTLVRDKATMTAFATSSPKEKKIIRLGATGFDRYWRQLIYVDTNTLAQLYSRQYPAHNELLSKEIRHWLETLIAKELKIKSEWIIGSSRKWKHNIKDWDNQLYYNDIVSYDSGIGKAVALKANIKAEPEFEVGTESIPCLICGDEIYDGEFNGTCNLCS